MKNLVESLLDVDDNIKNLDKNIWLKDYNDDMEIYIDSLLEFGWDTVVGLARRGYIDREGLKEYSRAAKASIKSAGKKYAKLLEKLVKPIYLRKSKKTLEEIKNEFINTDYFKEDAWEWAPNAGTDLFWDNIMDYHDCFEKVEIYMEDNGLL